MYTRTPLLMAESEIDGRAERVLMIVAFVAFKIAGCKMTWTLLVDLDLGKGSTLAGLVVDCYDESCFLDFLIPCGCSCWEDRANWEGGPWAAGFFASIIGGRAGDDGRSAEWDFLLRFDGVSCAVFCPRLRFPRVYDIVASPVLLFALFALFFDTTEFLTFN